MIYINEKQYNLSTSTVILSLFLQVYMTEETIIRNALSNVQHVQFPQDDKEYCGRFGIAMERGE